MVTTAKTARFGHRPSMRRLTLCLAIVFSFCQLSATNTATAATYYVDNTNGNDTYDGNQAKPWKTLDRTYTWYSGDGNKVQEGDTVLFRNGNYGTFSETSNYGASYLFYRNNWITYRAADGHTPTLNSIVIKNIDKWNGLGDGRSYLIIKGMNIQKGATIDHTSYVRVESCNITGDNDSLEGYNAPYNKPSGYGVGITYAQNIQVQNNEISYCYRGISVSSSTDINIVGNTIHRIGEDGMSIDAVNLLVEDNLIYDLLPERTIINIYGSQQGTFAVGEGVALQNTNARGIVYAVKPTYLQIYQTTEASFHSLWVAKTSDVLVGLTSGASIPDITNVDPSHCDGFQIMPGTVNATIQKNRIIRVVGGGEDGQGFKFDNPTGVNFVNNLIYTNVAHGSIITCTADVNLYNNTITGQLRIFAGHSAGTNRNTVVSNMYNNIIGSLSHEGDASGYTINVEHHGNNIFGNNPNGAPGPTHPFYVHTTEIASHNINSLFVNAANNDFNLAPNSAAINFGNPNYGPSSDILGHSRDSSPDAGCYEYVGSPPTSIGPPNADAGSDRTVTDSDQSGSEQVALDGSGSSGNIADSNYVWTWTTKDGNKSATGVKPTVSLPVGRYTITLTVTDNSGRTDTDTVVITVEVEEGLVGLWKFNEGSGSYANDSSGYSITGRLLNSPLWTSQGEISFDGYNDAVEVNTATLNISSGTVTLWVNPRGFSKSKHYLFGHLTQPANNRIQLFCNASGTLGVGLGNNASTNTNIGTLNTQEWYHIALTWSNTSYAVFVDGQQKDSGTFSGISAKQTYADIGNSGNKSQLSEAFYGLIDEVRLYDRALSANEVANHALVFLPIGDKIVS